MPPTHGADETPSAALDLLTSTHIAAGRAIDAARSARRRVELVVDRPVEPAAALELKDALHMAVLASVGAGDLVSATECGEKHRTLAFLREQRDLAVEPTLLPEALAGRWNATVTRGELFLEDWIAAGRRPVPGRAIGPCAVAMAHGLLGRHAERERWLGFVAELRGIERPASINGTGYGELFQAILLLDRDQPDLALAQLARDEEGGQFGWYGPLLSQWRSALRAEAAVLTADADASQYCAEAEQDCAGNPVATALTQRAHAIATGDQDALLDLAQRLSDLGTPYQQARTLMLTGGRHRRRGECLLEQLRTIQY
jgi:hypothetical protein